MGLGNRPPVYGLDIETDTSVDGLDPERSSVRTVALAQPGLDEEFRGTEPDLLLALDDRLADLAPGIIATWNGAAFDLPFLAYRARSWGMRLGLSIRLDQRGTYRAAWHDHGHVDAYRLYHGDGCGDDLSHEAQHAYAASDARLARVLTERRWGTAARFVDRLEQARPLDFAVTPPR